MFKFHTHKTFSLQSERKSFFIHSENSQRDIQKYHFTNFLKITDKIDWEKNTTKKTFTENVYLKLRWVDLSSGAHDKCHFNKIN